jgi:8-oxo-dGTP pyrophosphatase MutT (NUDIX family)
MKEKLKNQISKLPQSGRIIGHEEFRNAAVLILLFKKEGKYHFLFEKRSGKVRQPGEISFPGGLIDKGETVTQTALRETQEELGIDPDKIEILGEIGLLYSPLGATVSGVVGVADIDSLDDLILSKEEVDYVFSVPVDFFIENQPQEYEVILHAHSHYLDENGKKVELLPVKELGLPKMYEDSWGLGKPKVLVYKWKGEIIWGLTARFVKEVVGVVVIPRT